MYPLFTWAKLCVARAKIRFLLYFLGYFLLFSRHWFNCYGFSAVYTFFVENIDSGKQVLAAPVGHIFLVFLVRGFIIPLSLSALCMGLERRLSLRKLALVQWVPVALITYASLLFYVADYWVNWYFQLVFMCLVLWLNKELIWAQKIKSALYFLGFCLLGIVVWTRLYIGETSVEQFLSTIVFGVHGVLVISVDFILSILEFAVICPVIMTVIVHHVHGKIRLAGMVTILPAAVVVLGISAVSIQFNLIRTAQIMYEDHKGISEDHFAKNYINPSLIPFQKPAKPKNLVLIYIESLEATYQNEGIFGSNLLASLSNINQPSISFSDYKQSAGSNWTIAALVSTQCGIPLKLISGFDGNKMGEHMNNFLPAATCLGDVLEQQGYENVFINGSSLEFAGVGTFFKAHHYTELLGKEEWLEQGFKSSDMIGWGLPDDLLLQQAKIKLSQLMQNKKPFNLTVLTIDTHGPDGQLNQTCRAKGARDFEGIVVCTADEVADFIHFIEKNGWMDELAVVVLGDHMAMKNPLAYRLKGVSRTIFNKIISTDLIQKNRETIVHVDLFPTILQVLGITWGDDKLALGYGAVGLARHKLSTAKHFKDIQRIADSRSLTYDRLWEAKT